MLILMFLYTNSMVISGCELC